MKNSTISVSIGAGAGALLGALILGPIGAAIGAAIGAGAWRWLNPSPPDLESGIHGAPSSTETPPPERRPRSTLPTSITTPTKQWWERSIGEKEGPWDR